MDLRSLSRQLAGEDVDSGQRFPVRGKTLTGRDMVIHGGQVLSTYTHVTDQHTTYGTKIIVATKREAHYVLVEILGNDRRPGHRACRSRSCASLTGWGAWMDSDMQGGPVDELLDVAVERLALDQVQVEVGRTSEDRVHPGLTGERWEERHLDAVEQGFQ